MRICPTSRRGRFKLRPRSSAEAILAAAILATLAASVPAQRQLDELRGAALPADVDATGAVVMGDVDGDGDLDLLIGNRGQDRLYRNDGSGNYVDVTATHLPAAGRATTAVAIGDVDGDGDLDLVVGGLSDDRLYTNDGTGHFTDATMGRLPANPNYTFAVALGDVDGDGDLDVVMGSGSYYYQAPQNRLYLNDGSGTFADATAGRMPVDHDETRAVALGDVDGDGDLDIVFGTSLASSSSQDRLDLNDGTGHFISTTGRLPVISDQTSAVALGDVDGDGDLDLAVATSSFPTGQQNRLFLNDGSGTFRDVTAQQLPLVSDLTGDVALGDVDGDGDLDLVLAETGFRYGAQNRLYLNDGSGKYVDATQARVPADGAATAAVALGDVDGDGSLDLVCGNYRQPNALYLNDGSGTWRDATAPHLPVVVQDTRAVAIGDVDGDGDPDLVFGDYGKGSRLDLADGFGGFRDVTVARMPAISSAVSGLALGDVDGDGDLDLMIGNAGGPTVSQNRLFLNDGQGRFTDATPARMPADTDATRAVALVDVDGDGDLDVVFANDGQQDRLYRNDGSGVYSDVTAAALPTDRDASHAVATGDVDGDGDLDLIVGNFGQDRLYRNDGSGVFRDATEQALPVDTDTTQAVVLGDVDGDGDLDLVVGNGGGQQNRLLLGDGTGRFSAAGGGRLPMHNDSTAGIVLADIDGDGDLDMVVGNSAQDELQLNDGSGFFTDVTAVRMPASFAAARAVAVADLDRDGDLDVVLANAGQDQVLFDLQRQLDTPLLLRVGGTYRLDAYARYQPAAVAYPFVATGTASIPLPPFGTLGLDPTQALRLQPIVVPQPSGVGSIDFHVPATPTLIGASLYAQALLLLPASGQARLTNVTADDVMR